jgi:hypothetical protein
MVKGLFLISGYAILNLSMVRHKNVQFDPMEEWGKQKPKLKKGVNVLRERELAHHIVRFEHYYEPHVVKWAEEIILRHMFDDMSEPRQKKSAKSK